MSVSSRVVHHGPKPISSTEFWDALHSVCTPRFPAARHARPRRIALAISGGVDSMAMAFLFSKVIKMYPGLRIADHPASNVYGIIVNHQLRQNSSQEASSVAGELRKLGLKPMIKTVRWRDVVQDGQEPSSLPNIETVARELRYRMLGKACGYLNASSLFFAHHCDDQYETVLMRLMSGHSYRGLQGIREANDIPECYDLHGVYKSGLLDDQARQQPYLSFKPPLREMKHLRRSLRDDSEIDPWDTIRSYLGINDLSSHFPRQKTRDLSPAVPYLTPLDCEDGGVMVYRPLLQFDKDRLIATCEANKIKWFEDPTNMDPTYTPRNALRHQDRTKLPPHHRKEVVLEISRRAKRRLKLDENEAQRWLVHKAVIQDFDPNAGTLLVELPSLGANDGQGRRRLFAEARRRARKPRQRLIAAIAVRRLVEFVTPDAQAPPVASLENVLDRIFPRLASEPDPSPPRAFTVAGVAFEPTASPTPTCTRWLLSRAPYPSMKPLPERKFSGHPSHRMSPLADDEPYGEGDRRPEWRAWKAANLWDGRFWVRVSACVQARFHILPFLPRYAKPFRMALPPKQRASLEKILKHYAPGKIRYSLPALYSVETSKTGQDDKPTLTLLALPSLGIHVSGLDRWVRYEVRYRWIDASLLGLRRRGTRTPLVGYQQSSIKSLKKRKRRKRRAANFVTVASGQKTRQSLPGCMKIRKRRVARVVTLDSGRRTLA